MTTTAIRKKLSDYIQEVDVKRVKAMYALFENEIEHKNVEYSDEFKAELDRRYDYYKKGGKMISSSEADKQIDAILQIKKY